MKLLPSTLQRLAARERKPKPTTEKGDAYRRRYPVHTLAPDPDQPELDLEAPDAQGR